MGFLRVVNKKTFLLMFLISIPIFFWAMCYANNLHNLTFRQITPAVIYAPEIIPLGSSIWEGPVQLLTKQNLCIFHDGFFWPEIDISHLNLQEFDWRSITVDPETGSIFIYDNFIYDWGGFYEIKLNGEVVDRISDLDNIRFDYGEPPFWLTLTSWPGHYPVVGSGGGSAPPYSKSYGTFIMTEDGFTTYPSEQRPGLMPCYSHFVQPPPPEGPLLVGRARMPNYEHMEVWRMTPSGWVDVTDEFGNLYAVYPSLYDVNRRGKMIYNAYEDSYYLMTYKIYPYYIGENLYKFNGTEWDLLDWNNVYGDNIYSEDLHKILAVPTDASSGISNPSVWEGNGWKYLPLVKSCLPRYEGGRFLMFQTTSTPVYITKLKYIDYRYEPALLHWKGEEYLLTVVYPYIHVFIQDVYNALWDSGRNGIIVFGGKAYSDTYNGTLPTYHIDVNRRWTELAPSNKGPVYASECATCYSSALGGPVAFGGRLPRTDLPTTETVSNEMWLFTSENKWQKLAITQAEDYPTSRFAALIEEDKGTTPPVLVLIGGKDKSRNPIKEVWEFADGHWKNRTSEVGWTSNPDVPCSMVYDPHQKCLLCLFPDGAIWAYDKSHWEKRKSGGDDEPSGQLAIDERTGILYLLSIADGLFVSVPQNAILNHLLDRSSITGPPLKNSDQNNDGFLNIADLITLINK